MKTMYVSLVMLIGTISYANENMEIPLPSLIKASEIKYELPEGLLNAMISVESNGNHKAVNKNDGNSAQRGKGLKIRSYGLMQMQLDAARLVQRLKAKRDGLRLKKKDLVTPRQLMKPEVNVDYGAAYVKWLLDTHNGNVSLALTCFNSGPNSNLCKTKHYYGEYVGKVLNAMLSER